MADDHLLIQSTTLAIYAARRFARLAALFDAIRSHLPEGTYERSLLDMGLGVANSYSIDMRLAAQPEVSDD